MSLIASNLTVSQPQIDGRFYVVEEHQVPNEATPRIFTYLADPNTDLVSVMRDRAAAIEADLIADG